MGKRLYVGNLSFQATRIDIETFFAPFKLLDVKIVTDRDSGQPRGFAFVDCESDKDAADAARQLDGQEMMGRTLKINEAHDKPRSNNGGGGGGRRDDRGGGGGRGGSGGGGRGRDRDYDDR